MRLGKRSEFGRYYQSDLNLSFEVLNLKFEMPMKSPDKDVKQSLVYVNQELREIQDADYNRATPSCKWYLGLSWCLSGKESTCLSADLDSIPELGRSLGEGNDNPVQYSCLGNPMDGGVVGYRRWGHEKARQDLAPKQQPQ